jgi:periplasmic protein TonB
VFDTLIESKRKTDKKRLFGVGFVSLMIHTALIGAAILATVRAGQSDTKVRIDTTMVLLQEQQQKPPEQQPVQLDVPLRGFQTVIAPTEIPTNIPPIDLQQKFNAADYSGSGVEGGLANGMVPTGEVYSEALVDEKPDRLAGPQPVYPELLRQAGIQGRVLIQFVVDTMGKAEPNSIRIVQTPNPGFNDPAKNSVLHTLFRPGRVRGRAVRVLTELPFDFKIH